MSEKKRKTEFLQSSHKKRRKKGEEKSTKVEGNRRLAQLQWRKKGEGGYGWRAS